MTATVLKPGTSNGCFCQRWLLLSRRPMLDVSGRGCRGAPGGLGCDCGLCGLISPPITVHAVGQRHGMTQSSEVLRCPGSTPTLCEVAAKEIFCRMPAESIGLKSTYKHCPQTFPSTTCKLQIYSVCRSALRQTRICAGKF